MALRAVPDHPKFARLKSMLAQPRGATLGWLESVWHFAGRFTPHGNIGKYTDEQIEAWVEWNGDPGRLVAALVSCGWLDRDANHRLLVHDWAQHSDKATKMAVKRSELEFCSHTVPTEYPLPVPVPEAVPDPVPDVSEAKASSPRKDSGKPDPIEEIYKAYPRKVGKSAAIKTILRAVQHLKARGMPIREAEVYLFRRVQSYARSPAGNDGEFTPHPATWFNQGRYDDDPAEWQKKSSEKGTNYGSQGRNGFTGEQMSELLDSIGRGETDDLEPSHQ